MLINFIAIPKDMATIIYTFATVTTGQSRSFSSLQDAKDHLDGLYTQISKEEEEKQQAEWEAKMEEGRNYNSSDFKRSPNPNKPDIPPLTYSFWDKIKQRFYALLD